MYRTKRGDEGHEYEQALRDMATQEDVDLRFVDTHVGETRNTGPDGRKTYSLEDVYSESDFITYSSLYEGFGNALVEAFCFCKPVLVNRYSIFITDIEPCGFRTILMDGFLTDEVVDEVRRVLDDNLIRRDMVEHNYEVAREFFSFETAERELCGLIERNRPANGVHRPPRATKK